MTETAIHVDVPFEHIRQLLRDQLQVSESRTLSLKTALSALGDPATTNGYTADSAAYGAYKPETFADADDGSDDFVEEDDSVTDDSVADEVVINVNRLTLGEAVVAIINSDTTHVWSAQDVMDRLIRLGWKTKADHPLQVIRACLSLLNRKGKLTRSNRGRGLYGPASSNRR